MWTATFYHYREQVYSGTGISLAGAKTWNTLDCSLWFYLIMVNTKVLFVHDAITLYPLQFTVFSVILCCTDPAICAALISKTDETM
jgi:hypothetical protein